MKKKEYNSSEIEKKWKEKWEKEKIYSPNLEKAQKPFYNLMMFPYPSAEGLHMGSVFTFSGVDTYGRFKRMQGYDVFEPMGLDGFGIHSENYALKVGRHPKEQAKISEKNFYRQLSSIGNGFDWSRKLETYDPNYYKWTQWIFVQLFKQGLAYRKKAPVNFCPSCKTVLSDEQVIDGKCERCSTIVEKRDLEQWFFKITEYAERLLNNIPKLNWTEKVKIAQREWIGKKEGARVRFKIKDLRLKNENSSDSIEVFTTRSDTLYGATFIVLAPEHPVVAKLLQNSEFRIQSSELEKIRKYVQAAKKKTEMERGAEGKDPSTGSGQGKTGVFSGLYAVNPLSNQDLPVWIADYALMGYGTGALFGDAHDKRDTEFAKKYKIPLKPTVITGNKEKDKRILNLEECFTGYGTLVDSGEFTGLSSTEAIQKVTEWLEKNGKGGRKITYHLRDWLISRQRYWGPPIPMIYCQDCAEKGITSTTSSTSITGKEARGTRGTFDTRDTFNMVGWFPVEETDLPVLLPDVEDWRPEGTGVSPLANHPEFYKTKCPKCGEEARRETDVSDTFLDSAWYFFRYIGTELNNVPFPSRAFSEYSENSVNQTVRSSDNQKVRKSESSEFSEKMRRSDKWLPVTMYIGGAEHSVLHLLYSRFITMVFKDMNLISFEEPYARFYAHGLIIKDGAKMSKSKGNVINPDEYIAKYGVDTVRAYLRFVGPFDMGGDFRDSGIEGMHRFLKRVYRLVSENSKLKTQNSKLQLKSQNLDREMHIAIKQVTLDLENLRFNTAIAHIMEYYNELFGFYTQYKILNTQYCKTLVLLLAPIAPFLAEELWEQLGESFSVHTSKWPQFDPKMLKEENITIVIQVNGKVRDSFIVHSSLLRFHSGQEFTERKLVEKRAKEREKVKNYLHGKEIKKVIYIEGKIVNFVVSD